MARAYASHGIHQGSDVSRLAEQIAEMEKTNVDKGGRPGDIIRKYQTNPPADLPQARLAAFLANGIVQAEADAAKNDQAIKGYDPAQPSVLAQKEQAMQGVAGLPVRDGMYSPEIYARGGIGMMPEEEQPTYGVAGGGLIAFKKGSPGEKKEKEEDTPAPVAENEDMPWWQRLALGAGVGTAAGASMYRDMLSSAAAQGAAPAAAQAAPAAASAAPAAAQAASAAATASQAAQVATEAAQVAQAAAPAAAQAAAPAAAAQAAAPAGIAAAAPAAAPVTPSGIATPPAAAKPGLIKEGTAYLGRKAMQGLRSIPFAGEYMPSQATTAALRNNTAKTLLKGAGLLGAGVGGAALVGPAAFDATNAIIGAASPEGNVRDSISAGPIFQSRASEDAGREAIREETGRNEGGPSGYNATYGDKGKPELFNKKPLSELSISEVMAISQKRGMEGNRGAVGKYQFIPSTLKALVKEAGIDPSEPFNAANQDKLYTVFTAQNTAFLEKAGIEPTSANLRLAHTAGPKGAVKILNAIKDKKGDVPVNKILGFGQDTDAAKTNPQFNQTANQYVAALNTPTRPTPVKSKSDLEIAKDFFKQLPARVVESIVPNSKGLIPETSEEYKAYIPRVLSPDNLAQVPGAIRDGLSSLIDNITGQGKRNEAAGATAGAPSNVTPQRQAEIKERVARGENVRDVIAQPPNVNPLNKPAPANAGDKNAFEQYETAQEKVATLAGKKNKSAQDIQDQKDFSIALMQMGAAMMASKNPYFLGSLGEGVNAGLAGNIAATGRREDRDTKRAAQQETVRSHKETAANARYKLFQDGLIAELKRDLPHYDTLSESEKAVRAQAKRVEYLRNNPQDAMAMGITPQYLAGLAAPASTAGAGFSKAVIVPRPVQQ